MKVNNCLFYPCDWKLCTNGTIKRKNDIIYRMIVGYNLDYDYLDIFINISKMVYENIINGIYSVLYFPNSIIPILVIDDNYNFISLVKESIIDSQLLDEEQLNTYNCFKNLRLVRNKR